MRTISKEVLTVFCAVALSATMAAQPPGKLEPVQQRGQVREAKVTAERRMYEDIEVMRRILLGGLRKFTAPNQSIAVHSSQGGDASKSPAPIDAFHIFENVHQALSSDVALEGTYLKGYGVLFSASLPVQFPNALGVTLDVKSEPKPLSQWERVQKEYRGEILKEAEKSPNRKTDGFASELLRLVAENGYHFDQLADDEQLTVSITFRPADTAACVQCHGTTVDPRAADAGWVQARVRFEGLLDKGSGSTGAGSPGGMGGSGMKSGSSGSPKGLGGSKQQDPSALNSAAQSLLTEWENQILLGDLNAKQGRSKEAESAYQKAAERFVQKIRENEAALQQRGVENSDPSGYLAAVQLLNKVAQTAQAAHDVRAASDALAEMSKCLRELEKITQRQQRQVGTAPNQGTPIPTKIILSASKKLLTKVGAGKMSFDDFNKSVTVRFVRYPSSEENPGYPADNSAAKP